MKLLILNEIISKGKKMLLKEYDMGKLSISTPYFGNKNIYNKLCMPYPVEEAERFLNIVKPLLVGQKLDKVLVEGYYCDYEYTPFSEYDLDSCEWEGPFIFVINKEHFEIDIIANNHYGLGLNSIKIKNVVNTEKMTKKDAGNLWLGGGPYLDISHIFFNSVLKQKITDIEVTPGKKKVKIANGESYQYLENVIIKFENGCSLLVDEGLDNPAVHIIRYKDDL